MDTRALLDVRPDARARVAAGGKTLLYLVLAFVGALMVTSISKAMFGASLLDLARAGLAAGVARALLLLAGTVVLPSLLVLRLFGEGIATSGWCRRDAPRLLGLGLASGFGLLVGIAAVLWASGAATFRFAGLSVSTALASVAMSALLWLFQAAGEEGLSRGYAFVQACRALAFWPAAILSSGLFMIGHIGNEGETPAGIAAAGILGLLLSYSVLKTGSLWFALGFHASWNFAQSFLFGLRNSGSSSPAHLFSTEVTGPALLTGGTAGLEGSILLLPALVGLLAIIRWIAVETHRPGRDPGDASRTADRERG